MLAHDSSVWVRDSLARQLAPFICALQPHLVTAEMLTGLVDLAGTQRQLLGEGSNLSLACAHGLCDVTKHLGVSRWPVLKDVLSRLAGSLDEQVVSTLLGCCANLADVLPSELWVRDVQPHVGQLLLHRLPLVRSALVEHLAQLLRAAPPEAHQVYVQAMQKVIIAGEGTEMAAVGGGGWRLRRAAAVQLGTLAGLLELPHVIEFVLPAAVQLLDDSVAVVRQAAAQQLGTCLAVLMEAGKVPWDESVVASLSGQLPTEFFAGGMSIKRHSCPAEEQAANQRIKGLASADSSGKVGTAVGNTEEHKPEIVDKSSPLVKAAKGTNSEQREATVAKPTQLVLDLVQTEDASTLQPVLVAGASGLAPEPATEQALAESNQAAAESATVLAELDNAGADSVMAPAEPEKASGKPGTLPAASAKVGDELETVPAASEKARNESATPPADSATEEESATLRADSERAVDEPAAPPAKSSAAVDESLQLRAEAPRILDVSEPPAAQSAQLADESAAIPLELRQVPPLSAPGTMESSLGALAAPQLLSLASPTEAVPFTAAPTAAAAAENTAENTAAAEDKAEAAETGLSITEAEGAGRIVIMDAATANGTAAGPSISRHESSAMSAAPDTHPDESFTRSSTLAPLQDGELLQQSAATSTSTISIIAELGASSIDTPPASNTVSNTASNTASSLAEGPIPSAQFLAATSSVSSQQASTVSTSTTVSSPPPAPKHAVAPPTPAPARSPALSPAISVSVAPSKMPLDAAATALYSCLSAILSLAGSHNYQQRQLYVDVLMGVLTNRETLQPMVSLLLSRAATLGADSVVNVRHCLASALARVEVQIALGKDAHALALVVEQLQNDTNAEVARLAAGIQMA